VEDEDAEPPQPGATTTEMKTKATSGRENRKWEIRVLLDGITPSQKSRERKIDFL